MKACLLENTTSLVKAGVKLCLVRNSLSIRKTPTCVRKCLVKDQAGSDTEKMLEEWHRGWQAALVTSELGSTLLNDVHAVFT